MKKLLFFLTFLFSLIGYSQTTAFSETFETANSLTLVNGSQTNKWYWGTTTSGYCNGVKGLNISNNGTTYAYTITATSRVHAYFDVVIPAGATSLTLNFNCKVNGELNCDDIQVWSCPNTFTPTAGTAITTSNGTLVTTRQGIASCTAQTFTLTNSIAGTTRRIIFQWRNDNSAGSGSGTIDNITFTYVPVSTAPGCASLSSPSNGATNCPITQTITWAATAGATGYDVYFGTSSTPPLVSSNQAGTTYNPGTLATNTTYYHKIVPRNSVGPATGCNTWSFTTLNPPANDNCSGATSLPCGTNALAGTTVNAVSETAPNGSTTGTMGVWYSFAGDGQSTTITIVQSLDTRLLVLTSSTNACGGTYTTVANVDYITSSNEVATFTSTVGTTYYVYVGYYTSGSNTGTFTISRTCVTPPSNNNCSSAPALTVAGGSTCSSPTNGTTVGATQSSAACAGTADDDVWYSFVAAYTSQIITVTPGTMSDAVFQVYGGTCAGLTSLACVDNTLGSSSETTTVNGLTIGSTYYVRVHSYGNGTGQGTFTICASTPCTTPTTAGTLSVSPSSTGTVNDAFTFTTTGNAGSITKFEWSYNNFTSVAGSTNNPANPYTLILNVQQTEIWFRTTSVSGTCPAGVTTPISVTLQSAPAYVYGTDDGDYISNVTLNTINNNSTYDSPLGDSYQDFTSIQTTLIKGSSYNLSVSSPVTFMGSASGYAAWIDFNNNGIFEVSENIMQKAPSTTQTQSFTVPSGAATALVKMRVLSTWNTTPTTDAYNSAGYNWGEIEEYKINVQGALPIELMYLEGQPYGDRTNLIVWKTASENNCSHYNILHSEDGESWEVIETIGGSNNSTTQIEYSYIHTGVKPIINYYKLTQYDFDGVYEIYGPISINNIINGEKIVVKYLNLSGQEINFDQAVASGIYIEVYSDGTIRKIVR